MNIRCVMIHNNTRLRTAIQVFVFFMLLLLSIGCQSAEDSETLTPTATKIPATPIQALLQTQIPASTETAMHLEPTPTEAMIEPPQNESTLLPSPTDSPEPEVTPTPPPEPTFYVVQSGDTLIDIADNFNVSLDALVVANGFASLDELALVVGSELEIPLCEAHEVMPGNTLASIAQICGHTLDELIVANIERLAPLGSLEAVPVGFVLYLPQESNTPEGLDCSTQPAREQVIEYKPAQGEGLFCLSQKFGVSTASIIQGNADRLTGGAAFGDESLLIAPADGALYTVTADDIDAGTILTDLADWYDVELEAITDWIGNPVSGSLIEGQQLFINGANLAFGIFQPQADDDEGGE